MVTIMATFAPPQNYKSLLPRIAFMMMGVWLANLPTLLAVGWAEQLTVSQGTSNSFLCLVFFRVFVAILFCVAIQFYAIIFLPTQVFGSHLLGISKCPRMSPGVFRFPVAGVKSLSPRSFFLWVRRSIFLDPSSPFLFVRRIVSTHISISAQTLLFWS